MSGVDDSSTRRVFRWRWNVVSHFVSGEWEDTSNHHLKQICSELITAGPMQVQEPELDGCVT